MLISGLKKAYVGILTFGWGGPEKFEIQEYDFNSKFIETVVTKLVSFWNDHVKTGIPPAPVNNDDLKLVHPESNGNGITADDELVSHLEILKQFKQTRSEVDLSIKDIELIIKKTMGDHEFIVDGETTLATWKSGAPRSSFDSKSFRLDHPDLYQEYTKQSGPIRIFRLK
jgi:predicted phage-related endonuclease